VIQRHLNFEFSEGLETGTGISPRLETETPGFSKHWKFDAHLPKNFQASENTLGQMLAGDGRVLAIIFSSWSLSG
jgi:hypothetical protein